MIMPLRLKSNIKIYPILIIDQNEHIPSQIWTEIQYFPDIYYMKGDLRKQEYLLRAGVANALAVIILAKYNSEYESQGMLDINSIFIYNSIKRIFNKTLIIADLLSINSIELLSQKNENLEEYGFWLNQAFISGELYINSMLDTLICQAFYNPYIVNIITQMMLGESAFKFDEEKTNDLNKDKLLKSSLYLFKIKGLLEKYKYDNIAGIIETHHISFKSLFEFLIENNKVPIGVLRNLDGIHKFVFLAPDTDTLIDIEKDKVYIISSEESSGLDDRNKNYSEKYSIDLIEKSNAMLNDLAEIIKRDMDEINYKLQKDLNVKELIGITRMQLQKELINVHEKEMEKIIKDIPSELKKNTEEIKEDSNEIENSSNSD
jgi:potassium large conductance calcium-activated channel subfamily M alpha protein 1